MSQPIRRTLVETHLNNRGIKTVHDAGALRFHPHCYYRPDESSLTEIRPAMIAAFTNLSGAITSAHRTWLAPDGFFEVFRLSAVSAHPQEQQTRAQR